MPAGAQGAADAVDRVRLLGDLRALVRIPSVTGSEEAVSDWLAGTLRGIPGVAVERLGSPTMAITAAVAGNAPTSVTSAGNTWAVTCNQSTAKITASIGVAMPAGMTLSANLGAPAGATSAGIKALGTAAVDVVTGITKLNASGLTLSYQLDATAAAGVITSTTRVVTYTITGGV